MNTVIDHKTLVDALGGNAVVAKANNWPAVRVGQWKITNRIPPEYWPAIIKMAADAGMDFITSDWLMNSIRPRTNTGEAA